MCRASGTALFVLNFDVVSGAGRQDLYDNYFTLKKLTDILLSSALLTFAEKFKYLYLCIQIRNT
jgi:hypothetical protein